MLVKTASGGRTAATGYDGPPKFCEGGACQAGGAAGGG
jgi:hypothetical protein